MAEYIPGDLEMKLQGMLEDIDIREKKSTFFLNRYGKLNFQILLTNNYYVNPNNIHICFPVKIKKSSNAATDIDGDLKTVNNFFALLIKEISVTKYGSNKELIPTFSPCEIYQYSDNMLKHFSKDALLRYQAVFYTSTSMDRRIHNGMALEPLV